MTISQAPIIINKFSNLYIIQQAQMDAPVVNYVFRPFEGNINNGYPQGIKPYIQATKEIGKENDKLNISVSNVKYIIYHFLNLTKEYGWICLAFMVETGAFPKEMFRQV